MADLDLFRLEVREWIAANCPPAMRRPVNGQEDVCSGGRKFVFQSAAQREWLECCAGKGYTAPTWPKEFGGAGLNEYEARVLAEELTAIKARPPLEDAGTLMLGPALLKFGNAAQKAEHLPKIARGEIRWSQGFSEPNAGSDLASLQTRCEDRGDHWLVNGQKIWTSFADKSDWIFCLVRTDPEAPKHLGISFLLIDLASPGVTVRPITLLSGRSHFCETFFDNVEVPKGNLVGELNRGWDIAKFLLTHERSTSSGARLALQSGDIGALACHILELDGGPIPEAVLRNEIARVDMDTIAFGLLVEQAKNEADAGQPIGAKSSILKYCGAELQKRRTELLVKVGGSAALEWESAASHEGSLARAWLLARSNSIAGGTSEINLGIIAKRILNLPET